ncbi:hypothetical protein HBI08_162990 [Parastagonospora nodorum]|nr:hypothetical protein HBI08_162990 [Parastagonospora nodorum]
MLFLTSYAIEKVHIYAADSLSSTIIVYNYIKKNKNTDLVIANSISDALDICAKDNLIRQKSLLQLAEKLAIAESITAKDSNYVNTFSLDFAFSFANILSLIAFIISYRLFADKLVYALNRAIVVLIIILRSTPSTLLAKFIPITKIRNPLLKILLTSIKKNCYCMRYTKHYNFNIYVSLATDTLHLLLKGLVMKMLDFMQDILDNIYLTVISLLFILKAPFALHFICAVCNLVILAQYKRALERINVFKKEFRVALDSICTRANSKAYYITIRTALLAADYATIVKQKIQPYLTKLPLSKVAVNIVISNFIYAAAQFSSKRHNNSKYCNKEVVRCLYLILIIINYICYDKDRKHIAYIRAFSKVLLFNNNRQINNTTRILSIPFKFYDLSTIICLVHLVLRDLPNLITYTTMSYYVNNYIN